MPSEQMIQPSVNMPESLIEEIDDARHPTTSRSQWIRDAIRARLDAERGEVVEA